MRSSIILTFSFLSVLFAQTKLGSDIDGEAGGDINEIGTALQGSSWKSRKDHRGKGVEDSIKEIFLFHISMSSWIFSNFTFIQPERSIFFIIPISKKK